MPQPEWQRGGDATSAIMMKHVRKIIRDKKVTTHSLRHRIEDNLIEAGIPEDVRDMILGHSSGRMGENYGGPESRLKVSAKALKKALGVD